MGLGRVAPSGIVHPVPSRGGEGQASVFTRAGRGSGHRVVADLEDPLRDQVCSRIERTLGLVSWPRSASCARITS